MDETAPRIPGYEILDELGRGGMGIVYRALNLQHRRVVALKLILRGRGANILELARFRIEAQAVASLDHPNIVRIHEVGVHQGYPFLVLEFAEGGSLAERIPGGRIPCHWAARLCRTLALAMQHAHDRGIIHRDLKPGNVLLTRDDIPWVTDFGLARFATREGDRDDARGGMTIAIPSEFHELTRLHHGFRSTERLEGHALPSEGESTASPSWRELTASGIEAIRREDRHPRFQDYVIRSVWERSMGAASGANPPQFEDIRQFLRVAIDQASEPEAPGSLAGARLTDPEAILGTPQYMAPEQAWGRSEEVGPLADIYSLGAILYELLTGRAPFRGAPQEVVEKARNHMPVPPRRRSDAVDPALEAICLKCLAKNPDRRYQSMAGLAEDLQHYMDGGTVVALHEPSAHASESTDALASSDDDTGSSARSPASATMPWWTRIGNWWRSSS